MNTNAIDEGGGMRVSRPARLAGGVLQVLQKSGLFARIGREDISPD